MTTSKSITEKERPVWSNGIEFLMSCIANSVGLGNVWRFPFIAYENGGGAFLIPYIIILIVIGKPMYYLEMAIGQFTSKSSLKMYNVCPALKGIGLGQLIGTTCIATYYCSLIAITMFYFIASFSVNLPWAVCQESWPNCVDSKPSKLLSDVLIKNSSVEPERQSSSAELYFLKEVLKAKEHISDGIGYPDWKLALFLLLAWLIVFLVIIRGVKSSGKVAYFLAIFPYVILFTLLGRAVTLEGAVDGILYFITPKWDQLLRAKVWKEAIVQLFFSLTVAMGSIITYSSYNKFDHNIYRDAMIITTLDTFTSLLSGFTMFGILGNLAHNLGYKNIDEVVKSGTGLAFISYPDAISKFDVIPQLFAVLFFFMLLTLGIGSQVALVTTIVSVINDEFESIKYWRIALFVSCIGFLIGLVYITPGGQWILNLIDSFAGTLLMFCLAIFEITVVFWIYGLENFCLDLEFMTGRKVTIYWRICWICITPIFMITVFIYFVVSNGKLQYGGMDYPDHVIAAGWAIFAIGVGQSIIWAGYVMWTKYESSEHTIIDSFKPNASWGPADTDIKAKWITFKKDANEKRLETINTLNLPLWKQWMYMVLGKYR